MTGIPLTIRKNALVIGGVITLFTWILMAFGAFRIPDGLVYNLFVRLSPQSASSGSNVLVIKADFERMQSGDEVWLKLLRELRRQGARQIVFTFLPGRAGQQFYAEAAQSNVVFGRRIREAASISGENTLEPFPAAAAGLKLPFGVIDNPPQEFGMHRYQAVTIKVGGVNHPSLEAAAAGYLGIPPAHSAPFLINFNGRSGGLPHVSLEQALEGGLIPELVKGKAIIVGFSDLAHEAGLHTPLAGERDVPLIDYRAHALDTLISANAISEPPLILQMLFIALIVFTGLMLKTFLEIHFLTWLTLAAIAAYMATCWLLLIYGKIWFPATESLAAFFLTFLIIFRQRVVLAEEAVDNMLLSLSAKLKQRVMPESFYSSQEYWAQVITMVNQNLNLTRAIFLEKVPGDHRIREIKSLHCSITDISEMRRDYTRTPYSTAIATGGPIRIEGTNYLTKSETPEEQYLVPLIFGGQPLGFWAFGIAPDKAAQIPHFKGTIIDFGRQISELLYRRQEWQKEQQRKNSFAGSYLDLSRNIPHEEMRKALDLFESRVNILETVFTELGTATILYNLFGRVLLVNRRMVEIARNAGLAPYEMTALDLLVTLSGLPAEEARQRLNNVLIEHDEITLASSPTLGDGKEYLLRIRPLVESGQKLSSEDASLFSVYGILLEMIDLKEVTGRERIKEQFIKKLTLRLSELLEPLAAAAERFEDATLDRKTSAGIASELQKHASGALLFAQNIAAQLENDQPVTDQDMHPVDGIQLLRDAAALAERKLLQRRITTSIAVPGNIPFVWASPHALEVAFRSFILMLGNDAAPNTSIGIDVRMEQDLVVFRFDSTGFGMPEDVFNRYLFSDEPTDSVLHRNARSSIRHVRQWQGTVEASSEIGAGSSITVRLKKFTLGMHS